MIRHLRAWLRRGRLDDEIREELAQHAAWTSERLQAEGVPPGEARRRAAIAVGSSVRLREDARALWGFPTLDSVIQDVRYGCRQLRRTPVFTLATIATLALTIGGTCALFAVANAVVLRPLAFPRSDRMVSISVAAQGADMGVMDEPTARLAMASPPPSFESLATYNTTGSNFVAEGVPERVAGARVSARFFDVLRVQPARGRTFVPADMAPGAPPVVILSEALASRAFGSSADPLGRQVILDDRPYSVIGVMPPGAGFPARRDYWLPLAPRASAGGGFFYTQLLGRLRNGVPASRARDDLASLRRTRAAELPAQARDTDVRVMSLHDRLYGSFAAPLTLLLGVVIAVLLIGCANVANLLLARASVRRQELTLRTALGANRGRITRQLLAESLLLALLGAAPGLAVAAYALRAFLALGPAELTRIPGIVIDTRVLVFTVAVTVVVGLLFGVVPAVSAARMGSDDLLKGGPRSSGRHGTRPRRALVALELAAAVVVTIGAALLAKSLIRFEAVDRRFDADRVLTASMTLPRPRYADPAARRAFYDGVLERVRALPAIEAATMPAGLDSLSMTMPWPAGSRPGPPGSPSAPIGVVEVGASNFRTFGIPMLSGRDCDANRPGAARSVVVNDRMARRAFPGQSVLGRQIDLGSEGSFAIVGVSADVFDLALNAVPLAKVFICADGVDPSPYVQIALRARAGVDAASLAPALREIVRAVDPAQPVADIATVRQHVDEAGASRRFDTLLFGAFAGLAFVLAVFGLYAVTAYLVAQRSREFGIRMALGARRGTVLLLVVRQALAPAAAGICLGLVASAAVTRLLRSMLFEVGTLDPGVFAGVAVVLAIVATLAAVIPARRAVHVDPAVTLRCE